MAITITQNPSILAFSQSPVIFTVFEDTPVINEVGFQYICELWYWDGGPTDIPIEVDYTLIKYPNRTGRGIFDVSKILNSVMTDRSWDNTSKVKYYAVSFSWFVEGVGTEGEWVSGGVFKIMDGYSLFTESINTNPKDTTPHWPIMSSGPAVQNIQLDSGGRNTVYTGITGGTQPNLVKYTGQVGGTEITANYTVFNNTFTGGQMYSIPIGPGEGDFPATLKSPDMTSYTIQAYNGGTPLGEPMKYNIVCERRYPNVRIGWKNRYGGFDWMDFNGVKREGFNTTIETYQPQIGTWNGGNLVYGSTDTSRQVFVSDSTRSLQVNTDWLHEEWNEILKEMMVSDEIYWLTDDITPITIASNSVIFKTGVVDKLIQYTFEFEYGRNYKLVL